MRFKATIHKNGTIVTEAIGPDGRTICSESYALAGGDVGRTRETRAHPQAETPRRRQRRKPTE